MASARTPCKLKQTSLYGVITLAGGLKGQNGPTTQSDVRQIIDLALLTNGMLKGKNLTEFIQRSISLIEK